MPNHCDVKKLIANTKAGRWWEEKKQDGVHWKIMRHNGVLFPEPYKPLPKNVKLKYKEKKIELENNPNNPLNISAEEAAVFFAMKLDQDERNNAKRAKKINIFEDEVFTGNFLKDWKKTMSKKNPLRSLPLKEFKNLDFSAIVNFIVKRSEQKKLDKKEMTKEEKEEEKKKKEETKDIYGYAIVDDIKIPIGNYMVQPPGLYMGHGKHPSRGKIKNRIKPTDITLNVSKKYIPKCFSHGEPCKWGKIIQNHESTMVAKWENPITKKSNYVNLSRDASPWACMDTIKKFDKARKLGKNIKIVRRKYKEDLKSKNSNTRQFATAVYLLDEIAIRPGSDKDETKEAGTLGLTTLKCGNVQLLANKRIKFSFIGKSSIKFNRTVVVNPSVYKNIKELCGAKSKKTQQLFPDVNETKLNDYLKTILPGITAKVFRTYKASITMQNQLNMKENIPSIWESIAQKQAIYNKVNIAVALALNHKRQSDNTAQVAKLTQKLEEYKEERKKNNTVTRDNTLKKNILSTETKLEAAKNNLAMTTSKQNYIDPRIVVSWCKKIQIPIEKIYTKTQLQKFVWAMETSKEWNFIK